MGVGFGFGFYDKSCVEEESSIDLEDYFRTNRKELRDHRVRFSGTIPEPCSRMYKPAALRNPRGGGGRGGGGEAGVSDAVALARAQLFANLDYKSLVIQKRSTFAVVERFEVREQQTGTLGPGSYDFDVRKVTR